MAEDIVMLLLAHAGVLAGSGRVAERMSDRLLGYFLEAFAAPGVARGLIDALVASKVRRCMPVGMPFV